MIAVIDYGMGNLRSVEKALQSLGYDAEITSDPEKVLKAEKAVLPGVGAFADCYNGLAASGLREAVLEYINTGRPMLGICVGMQLLFDRSLEFGEHDGLGVFRGTVKKFPDELALKGMKIPQMGWNIIDKKMNHPLLDGINTGDYFYFVHSYCVKAEEEGVEALSCTYGIDFSAMVIRGNVAATQFHPEKSQKTGLRLLKNFGEWKC